MINIFETMGKSKYTEWILNIMLVIMLSFVGVITYWQVKEYEVITPLEGNYALDKTVFKQGDEFKIHLKICKNMEFREDVYGRFIDGVIFSVPENTSDFDTGCYDTYITSVKIPHTLPAGKYVYEEKIIYRVNPLKEVEYVFTTPEFEVIE